MKILFLHISDIHIEKQTDINEFHVRKIVDSLHVTDCFDHVIIVISGDIAYSGKPQQYDYAWQLIGKLVADLKNNYSMKLKPTVLLVPGNHDMDLSIGDGDLGHEKIQKLHRNNKIDSKIQSECEKLLSFLDYSNKNNCLSSENPLYNCRIIDLDGFKIEVNLLNTALFSTLDEEKGLHYLPPYIINKISEPTGADFVITIMHHSYHWFISENKKNLEQILLVKSSLLFLGHEHNLDSQEIIPGKVPGVQVLAGGELSNRGDWTNSEYFVSMLDTENFMFKLYGFKWNSSEKYYQHSLLKSDNIPNKPSSEKKLIPCKDYLNTFFQDEKYYFANDFSEYFVFPRLQREERTEHVLPMIIANENKFLEELEMKKKVIIVGYDNTGKTVLLKQLFKSLSVNKVVLFCDIYSISSGKCDRIFKSVFENIYGDDPHDYSRFQQTPKQNMVLIIDDVHRVNEQHFDAFIKEVENKFEYIIFSTNNVMELDINERIKKVIGETSLYQRYRILPFYSDKRNELISNIVRISLPDEPEEQTKISNILSDSLKKQRSLVNLGPDFIIQYTEYFCKNINDISQNGGEVFSKVFEANIVNSVKPNLTKKIKIDKLFIVIDKVAYYIHSNKSYPLKHEELTNIINSYNEFYDPNDPDLQVSDFIRITTDSKIIKLCGDGMAYKFCNKSYLAYFVAREIKRRYYEENDTSDLTNILNFACFGINADILLFLTYITDNPNMLRYILQMAKSLTSDWDEFDLNKINIPYLASIDLQKEVTFPTEEQKKREKEEDIEEEILSDKSNCLDPIDLYDYKEEDINELINQLRRSISLLCVISRCLPSFEHMMRKEDKELFVETIYRLPNQIFFLWANEVENRKSELIEFIKHLEENDYCREKHKIEDILGLLQWDSISFLLDLYYIAITNSTKENTEKFLNAFKYDEKITYSLQHLMVFEQREKLWDFIKDTESIFAISKNVMSTTMLMRIVRHLLIHSRTIQYKQIQQLEAKFLKGRNEHKNTLLQRVKNKN